MERVEASGCEDSFTAMLCDSQIHRGYGIFPSDCGNIPTARVRMLIWFGSGIEK